MQICLQSLEQEFGFKIIGLNQLGGEFPDVDEDGSNPLDNAKKKAYAYYEIIKKPVFSIDSGLYFEELPDELQPGLEVRRVNGRRLTDKEMISHYSMLAEINGGRITGRFVNGICLIMDVGKVYEHTGDDISTEKFYIVAKPHDIKVEGFPLDSLSVHIKSGKYYYDLNLDKEDAWDTDSGFRKFFRSAISGL